MQTAHGLDRVPSTKHVNHPSVKKGEIRDWNLSRTDPNTVLTSSISQCVGERGFKKKKKILHRSFFSSSIQLSKGSDSSYISHWIDLCFQQSSPLLVCWLVERWQIGFHSLHGGAQWSGFDRVKRNSASAPPPPNNLSFSSHAHTHTHTRLFLPLSLHFFFLPLSLPWGLENGWPCLTWTTLMSSPLHYCTYSTAVCPLASLSTLSRFYTHTRRTGAPISVTRRRQAEVSRAQVLKQPGGGRDLLISGQYRCHAEETTSTTALKM